MGQSRLGALLSQRPMLLLLGRGSDSESGNHVAASPVGFGEGKVTVDRRNPIFDNLKVSFAVVLFWLLGLELHKSHREVCLLS